MIRILGYLEDVEKEDDKKILILSGNLNFYKKIRIEMIEDDVCIIEKRISTGRIKDYKESEIVHKLKTDSISKNELFEVLTKKFNRTRTRKGYQFQWNHYINKYLNEKCILID